MSECRRGAGQSLVCLMRMREMKVNLGLAPASSWQSADRIVKVTSCSLPQSRQQSSDILAARCNSCDSFFRPPAASDNWNAGTTGRSSKRSKSSLSPLVNFSNF